MWIPRGVSSAVVTPPKKSELRAHQMARNCGVPGSLRTKSELKLKYAESVRGCEELRSEPEDPGAHEGLLPRLFGLCPCDRLLISTLVHCCCPNRLSPPHWLRGCRR